MTGKRIYLDHASGGPLLPEAQTAMEGVFSSGGAAPGGGHREARESRGILERARQQAADFLGIHDSAGVVFTSGGTEAVQAAVLGWGRARGKGTIYLSSMEHPSLETAAQNLGKHGHPLVRVPVDRAGRLQWKTLKPAGPGLVCLHLAHHDLGTVQDVGQAAAFADSTQSQLFLDASFGAGWVDLPAGLDGVDFLALSVHRMGGPKGAGILWIRSGLPWQPQLEGGRQEGDRRAGTENLPAIAGLGAALETWLQHKKGMRRSVEEAQRALLEGILAIAPCAQLHGPGLGQERNPAHLGISFAGLEAEALALLLDRVGVAARGGSGCVTREMKIPPAMLATGAEPEQARSLILFTLGIKSQAAEMQEAAARVGQAVRRLQAVLPL